MVSDRRIAVVANSLAIAFFIMVCQAQLQELCSSRSVQLHSKKDLDRTSAEGCPAHTAGAFEDLVELVREPEICTMDKATRITEYHDIYIKHQIAGQLPRELVRFAVAYGMQVHDQCSASMTIDLLRLAFWNLEPEDFEALEEWISDGSSITRLLSLLTNQGDYFQLADFSFLVTKEERNELPPIIVRNSRKLIRAEDICEKRFRPIYEPMILPIAHLSRNGFHYRKFQVSDFLALHPLLRKQNERWSRIIFLCETLKELRFFDEISGPATSYGKEQLHQFKSHAIIKEPILEKFNFRLNFAIDSFNASESESDRIKKEPLNKKIRSLYTAPKLKFIGAALVKKIFELAAHEIRKQARG